MLKKIHAWYEKNLCQFAFLEIISYWKIISVSTARVNADYVLHCPEFDLMDNFVI